LSPSSSSMSAPGKLYSLISESLSLLFSASIRSYSFSSKILFSVEVNSSPPKTRFSSSMFRFYKSRIYSSLCFKYCCLLFIRSSGTIYFSSSSEVSF
jgi:hypothetical protein